MISDLPYSLISVPSIILARPFTDMLASVESLINKSQHHRRKAEDKILV